MKDLFDQGYGGIFLTERYSKETDSLMAGMLNSIGKDVNFALLATGGYGRQEMAPYSDVDILFIAPDRKNTGAAEQLLHTLWDTGMTISHAFRTPDECIEEAFRDIRTKTSLLEARFIAGDIRMYDDFNKKVLPEIIYRNRKNFISEKLREMQKRHSDSGGSVYILEPNIKEGEGGLRDVHTAYWLSKVALRHKNISDFSNLLSAYEYKRFQDAYDFLLRARFCLHLECKRKNDVLSFEYQKNTALSLGFRDSRKFRSSERLMRYYYLKSKVIKDITRKVMTVCSRPYVSIRRDMNIKKLTNDFSLSGGSIISTKSNLFAQASDKIMESYYVFSKTGRRYSDSLREEIRSSLLKINKRTRNSGVAISHFLSILKGDRVYETIREMHETGVLSRFIPEFGALRSLVIHEPYHMYTVDEHTLLAIRNLESLRTSKYGNLEHLRTIINGIERIDALFIALLLHDIGKAAGRHHEEEGYKRLKNILERFQLKGSTRTRIEFLVRNHVLMSKIALRREIGNIETIAGFADAVGDAENLKAIYLITYADMSAVNAKFWNSWKAYLLRELYEHTMEYLSGIKESRPEYVSSLLLISPAAEAEELRAFVEEMPDRYMLSTVKSDVVEDCNLVMEAKKEGFAMRAVNRSEGVKELIISTRDFPGLFSKIVGFLSSKGLNIVHGRIFTGKNGIIIDKISISNWKEVWWEGLEDDLQSGLRNIILNGKSVTIVRRRKHDDGLFDVFIELDNETSEEYSIIELFSHDRLGLLYDVSQALHEKGVNIDSARINTESGLAQDVFYVQLNKEKLNYSNAEGLLSELWTILRG